MNYQPTQATESTEPSMPASQPVLQPTTPPVATTPQTQKPKKSKAKYGVCILILVLLAAVAGVYYWQHQQVQTLQGENNVLIKKLAANYLLMEQQMTATQKTKTSGMATTMTPATPVMSSDVVTGEVSAKAIGTASVNGLYLPGKITAIWIEYGITPTALSKTTPHVTKELGTGATATYVSQSFNLTQLNGGTDYFYRVAATQNGKTIYGGVAGFAAQK